VSYNFMSRQIHVTTFIISTPAFTWHYKGICNMLWNSTTWFTSCTHHSLGCRNDIENITNKIVAFILTTFDEKKDLYNTYKIQTHFTKLQWKKFHTCGNKCNLNKLKKSMQIWVPTQCAIESII
jgi:hypothetical protein